MHQKHCQMQKPCQIIIIIITCAQKLDNKSSDLPLMVGSYEDQSNLQHVQLLITLSAKAYIVSGFYSVG